MDDAVTSDIIIVGGGSAGCVLASRISEDPRLRVLLLEAGPDLGTQEPPDIIHPFPRAYANPAYFTNGLVASILNPADLRPYTQARLLGGGSAVMGMWALRGLAEDFDMWSRLGATGWSHSEVLPYFKRLETDADFQDERHGRDGPVSIHRVPAQ